MFKITNISRDQHICGLYPGKSKKISSISEQMRELQKHQLLHIVELPSEEIKDKRAPKESKQPVIQNLEEDKEVETDGRS